MPTYDYHCSSCNATYELRQGFDAAIEHLCEECKNGKAKRVLHAPRVLFKGSGFYATDSKSKSSSDTAESPSSSSSDSKSESKTPAATETAASSSNPSSSD